MIHTGRGPLLRPVFLSRLSSGGPMTTAPTRIAIDFASQGRPRNQQRQRLWEGSVIFSLVLCALFSVGTTASIIYVLFSETIQFFRIPEVSIVEFFTGLEWNPFLGAEHSYGVWPLIAGTLQIMVISACVSIPLGLLTAIYLSEYAPSKVRAVLKPVLEVLAGVPTVVYGFFALAVITPALQKIYSGFGVYNAMSAGIAVGIMCLPIVTSLSEDALRSVPRSLREAAYGVGATKFDVSVKVVTPAALSGVVAAFLLAIARAVGETMIVALAAGASPLPLFREPLSAVDPTSEVQTMTAFIVQVFLGDASNFGPEYYSSYAVAAMLFLMTLILTLLGGRVLKRFREEYE